MNADKHKDFLCDLARQEISPWSKNDPIVRVRKWLGKNKISWSTSIRGYNEDTEIVLTITGREVNIDEVFYHNDYNPEPENAHEERDHLLVENWANDNELIYKSPF